MILVLLQFSLYVNDMRFIFTQGLKNYFRSYVYGQFPPRKIDIEGGVI